MEISRRQLEHGLLPFTLGDNIQLFHLISFALISRDNKGLSEGLFKVAEEGLSLLAESKRSSIVFKEM